MENDDVNWKSAAGGVRVEGGKRECPFTATKSICIARMLSVSVCLSVCLPVLLFVCPVPSFVCLPCHATWLRCILGERCRLFVVHLSILSSKCTSQLHGQGEAWRRGRERVQGVGERERERRVRTLGILVGGRTSPPLMTFAIVARRFHDSLTTLPFPLKWFSLRKSAVCSAVMTARDMHEHVKSRADSCR